MLENLSGVFKNSLKDEGGVYCDKRSSDITLVLNGNPRVKDIDSIYEE